MSYTYETRLNKANFIDNLAIIYNSAKHCAFALICQQSLVSKTTEIKLNPFNTQYIQAKYNLNGRYVNSINQELAGLISSFEELRNALIIELQQDVYNISKSIESYEAKNIKISNKLNDLQYIVDIKYINYQVNLYHNFKITNKKPNSNFLFHYDKISRLPRIIDFKNTIEDRKKLLKHFPNTNLNILTLLQEYCKNLYQIKLLNSKKSNKELKLKKLQADVAEGRIRICFGGKTLFKQQHMTGDFKHKKYKNNKPAILYKNHQHWLDVWQDKRASQMFFTGAVAEPQRNQNCSAYPNANKLFDIRINLPSYIKDLRTHKDREGITYFGAASDLTKLQKAYDKINEYNLSNPKNKGYYWLRDVDFHDFNPILLQSLNTVTIKVRKLSPQDRQQIKDYKADISDLYEQRKLTYNNIRQYKLQLKSGIKAFTSDKLSKKNNKVKNQAITDIPTLSNEELKVCIKTLEKEKDELDSKIKSSKELLAKLKDVVNYDNSDKSIVLQNKKQGIPITYRFVRRDKVSNPWYLQFIVSTSVKEKKEDFGLGYIGLDFNNGFISVAEIDADNKLLQSFDIHLNPENYHTTYQKESKPNYKQKNKTFYKFLKLKDTLHSTVSKKGKSIYEIFNLPIVDNQFIFAHKANKKDFKKVSSDKMTNIICNAVKIIVDLSVRTGKPLVIEKLDFSGVKRKIKEQSSYKADKNYNRMISSFAYSKFKSALYSRASREGVLVHEVNPAYTSLIGFCKYVKVLGISVHQAAAYVIAMRYKLDLNNKDKKYEIKESVDNIKNLTIYYHGRVIELEDIENNLSSWTLWKYIAKCVERCKQMTHTNKNNYPLVEDLFSVGNFKNLIPNSPGIQPS